MYAKLINYDVQIANQFNKISVNSQLAGCRSSAGTLSVAMHD